MRAVVKAMFLLTMAGPAVVTAGAAKSAPRLRLEQVATPGASWAGPQFVRADRAGRVFVLRADGLEAYPVTKAGALGEPVGLQPTSSAIGHVLDAALSPSGNQWLVYAEGMLRLFLEGKERPLPPISWQPWTVGFIRDTPVVVVMPRPLPSAVLHLGDLGTVPWFVTLDGDRWSTLVEHSSLSAETAWKERSRMTTWVAEYAASMAPARDGKLWVASRYRYRLQRLSPTGRTLAQVALKEKKEEKRPAQVAGGPEVAAAVERMEAQGGHARFNAFTEEPVIADMVEGRDAIYLLVHTSGGLALDRYEPVLGRLDRAPLPLEGSGRFTLASGKDGLYLAPFDPAEGLWRISWSVLESALWTEIEGAEIQGGAN
jgi:hypothetical protein